LPRWLPDLAMLVASSSGNGSGMPLSEARGVSPSRRSPPARQGFGSTPIGVSHFGPFRTLSM
jgi:hypothetical protein